MRQTIVRALQWGNCVTTLDMSVSNTTSAAATSSHLFLHSPQWFSSYPVIQIRPCITSRRGFLRHWTRRHRRVTTEIACWVFQLGNNALRRVSDLSPCPRSSSLNIAYCSNQKSLCANYHHRHHAALTSTMPALP